MNDVQQVLTKAKSLITDYHNWARGLRADVMRDGPICAEQAIEIATGDIFGEDGPLTDSAKDALTKAIGGREPFRFNDNSTHDKVLAAFDRAIEIAGR